MPCRVIERGLFGSVLVIVSVAERPFVALVAVGLPPADRCYGRRPVDDRAPEPRFAGEIAGQCCIGHRSMLGPDASLGALGVCRMASAWMWRIG